MRKAQGSDITSNIPILIQAFVFHIVLSIPSDEVDLAAGLVPYEPTGAQFGDPVDVVEVAHQIGPVISSWRRVVMGAPRSSAHFSYPLSG